MRERCPLSSGSAPGSVDGEDFPEFCIEHCEERWEHAFAKSIPDHEEYLSYLAGKKECNHFATEHGNSLLQAVAVNRSVRLYSVTERCMGCSEEIAKDSFIFHCPNS